jgi:biotin operon repressor
MSKTQVTTMLKELVESGVKILLTKEGYDYIKSLEIR